MELKKYVAIIRKRIWLIAILILAGATVTGIYSYSFLEKQYAASTKLIVNQNQDLSVVNGKIDLGTINTNIQLIKTYKEIIQSPRIMKLVAEQYPDLGLNANQLIGRVGVSAVNESQVMSVTAVDTSYRRAANIANAVAEVFQKEVPTLMKVDNVSILNSADPEARTLPLSPNPNLNIFISVVICFIIGFGLVFLLEYLDDTVKTEEDVLDVLGLMTFAHVPRVKAAGETKKGKETSVRSEKNVSIEA